MSQRPMNKSRLGIILYNMHLVSCVILSFDFHLAKRRKMEVFMYPASSLLAYFVSFILFLRCPAVFVKSSNQ